VTTRRRLGPLKRSYTFSHSGGRCGCRPTSVNVTQGRTWLAWYCIARPLGVAKASAWYRSSMLGWIVARQPMMSCVVPTDYVGLVMFSTPKTPNSSMQCPCPTQKQVSLSAIADEPTRRAASRQTYCKQRWTLSVLKLRPNSTTLATVDVFEL